MLTLYAIPNCDTVKKARTWLDARGLAWRFHDYKKAGVPDALDRWVAARGWEIILNRQGQTFRKLPEADKVGLDTTTATALMRAHPSSIRRPVVTGANILLVGFEPDEWARVLT